MDAENPNAVMSSSSNRKSKIVNRKSAWLCVLLALAMAVAFRLPALSHRPMHTDEAVQADKFRQLWEDGGYVYHHFEYHGPTLNYLTVPAMWLSGARSFAETNEITFRIVPAAFGIMLVALLWWVRKGLGGVGTACAAALTAISPALVYYSRDYIHEMLFVFFSLAAVAAGWRWLRGGRVGWAIVAGAALGLMHATKETCVIGYFAMATGIIGAWWWGKKTSPNGEPLGLSECKPTDGGNIGAPKPDAGVSKPVRIRIWHIGVVALCAVLASILFYSSFFANWAGAADSVRAFGSYFNRSQQASEHFHPWYFYLKILAYTHYAGAPVWTEWPILALALVGAAGALRPRPNPGMDAGLLRFLVFYTLAQIVVYSALPYKTPWCMLSFLHGLILLAGAGAAMLVSMLARAWMKRLAAGTARPLMPRAGLLMVAALAAALTHLGYLAYAASFPFASDNRNPYAYAQTSPDLLRLVKQIESVSLGRKDLDVQVITDPHSAWPLPWYLRKYQKVGYWTVPPDRITAPVVIVSPKFAPAVDAQIAASHSMIGFYQLRPSVFLQMYVQEELWQSWVKLTTIKLQVLPPQ